jgi:hypothetical protein
MTDSSQETAVTHLDVKQWQHCSLFNLDLFNDENQHVNTAKAIVDNININQCCCSTSTPSVDDTLNVKHINSECSFSVLQKNYTTQLEHVAERLLANEYKNLNDCSCCQLEANDTTKGQSLNRKLLLGSTAILDNFLRNNVKTPSITNSNQVSLSTSTTSPATTVTNVHIAATVTGGTGNQRRWHSERGSRHPNVRANLPLTNAQRQVLERYMNYPIIPASTHIRPVRRPNHPPVTGKAVENIGTALSALVEQSSTTFNSTPIVHLSKDHVPQVTRRTRPLSSTSSSASAVSHHSALNRRCFLADTIVHNNQTKEFNVNDNDDENDADSDSISSELDQPSDEESTSILQNSSLANTLVNHQSDTLIECSICYELRRLQKRTCCEFAACPSCLTLYVEQQIKQGIIRIQCPNHQCHIYMHRDEIHKRCLSTELRQKFTRFFIDMNRSINMKTCPRCSNIHEIGLE